MNDVSSIIITLMLFPLGHSEHINDIRPYTRITTTTAAVSFRLYHFTHNTISPERENYICSVVMYLLYILLLPLL